MKLLLLLLSFNLYANPYALIGDAGLKNQKSIQVKDSIYESGVKKLILPGDNIYNLRQTYDQVWEDWLTTDLEFYVVAIGNHHQSYEEEIQFFNMPGEYFEKTDEYAKFIVLNSDNEKNAEEQARFLEQSIESSNKRLNFIIFHHPPVTISKRHNWEEKEKFQNTIRPIILKHQQKIAGIIVGHDHLASFIRWEKIPVIVSGAVFQSIPARGVNYQVRNESVRTLWANRKGHYWVRLDIEKEYQNHYWIKFINSETNESDCSIRVTKKSFWKEPNCYR